MAYIGTWPSTIGFRSVDFETVTSTRATETQSGRTLRMATANSKFGVKVVYPNVTPDDFRAIQAFATLAQGSLNNFDIVLPNVSYTRGGYPNQTMYVTAAKAVGDTQIDITTDAGTSITVLKAGDVVKFENHTKVYMVTADTTVNGSGVGTLNITPGLQTAIEDDSTGGNTAVTVNAVPFRMFINSDQQSFRYNVNDSITYEFRLLEDI
jgi:hypothetical protein